MCLNELITQVGILTSLVGASFSLEEQLRELQTELEQERLQRQASEKGNKTLERKLQQKVKLLILIIHELINSSEIRSPHACVIFFLCYILDSCLI